MSVKALCPEFSVKGLDEGIICRLAGPREVKRDTLMISPQVKITGDEL
jgi:hypothetical protein